MIFRPGLAALRRGLARSNIRSVTYQTVLLARVPWELRASVPPVSAWSPVRHLLAAPEVPEHPT